MCVGTFPVWMAGAAAMEIAPQNLFVWNPHWQCFACALAPCVQMETLLYQLQTVKHSWSSCSPHPSCFFFSKARGLEPKWMRGTRHRGLEHVQASGSLCILECTTKGGKQNKNYCPKLVLVLPWAKGLWAATNVEMSTPVILHQKQQN